MELLKHRGARLARPVDQEPGVGAPKGFYLSPYPDSPSFGTQTEPSNMAGTLQTSIRMMPQLQAMIFGCRWLRCSKRCRRGHEVARSRRPLDASSNRQAVCIVRSKGMLDQSQSSVHPSHVVCEPECSEIMCPRHCSGPSATHGSQL